MSHPVRQLVLDMAETCSFVFEQVCCLSCYRTCASIKCSAYLPSTSDSSSPCCSSSWVCFFCPHPQCQSPNTFSSPLLCWYQKWDFLL